MIKVENKHEAICPYCKTLLNKFPSRKTKCPNCKKSIFVKRLDNLDIKNLVTEEQAQEIDIEREKEYSKV
jgi:Zn finger protein HypA/HybF involved in hydrogenase expression